MAFYGRKLSKKVPDARDRNALLSCQVGRLRSIQEILPYRTEHIQHHPCFKADSPMHQVGCDIETITRFDHMRFPIDCEFEFSAVAKGGLRVKVGMLTGLDSLFEFYLHHHYLIIPPENLPGESGTKVFPLICSSRDPGFTASLHSFCFFWLYIY